MAEADLGQIRKLVIISMFLDDDLRDMLVLKGGNAMDIIHKISQRSSLDVDFSMEKEFGRGDLQVIEAKIEKALRQTFAAEGYDIFDFSFRRRPARISKDKEDFWGGYRVEFKIIEKKRHAVLKGKLDDLRRNAIVIGGSQRRKFRIDISKFEFCGGKEEEELDGYTIYVYSPEMIVLEKLRAICQQMPEYTESVSKSARARDFFDIYTIIEHFKINLEAPENMAMLKNIFEVKKVPLALIGKIPQYGNFHRPDFASVKDTVKPDVELKDFDFYLDYVVGKTACLKVLWEV